METFIILCIIVNVIVMAMAYDTSPSSYDSVLTVINIGFTGVFIAEALFKIIAFGIQGYLYLGSNKFDLFVVGSSIVDTMLSYIGK